MKKNRILEFAAGSTGKRHPVKGLVTAIGTNQMGFTLVEILVVIAIVVALAAVVTPSVTRFSCNGTQGAGSTELGSVQTSLHAMMAENQITTVDARSVSTQDWTSLPTGPGTKPLSNYLREPQTVYLYQYDSSGKIYLQEHQNGDTTCPLYVGVPGAGGYTSVVVNGLLQQTAFDISDDPNPDPTYPAQSPFGVRTVSGTWMNNTSDESISNISIEITSLTNGNWFLDADGGPGQEGSVMAVDPSLLGPDGVLEPGESFSLVLKIGLVSSGPFSFGFDIYGVVVPYP